MNARTTCNPVEILLVEDAVGDVRLTLEALRSAKVLNPLTIVKLPPNGTR